LRARPKIEGNLRVAVSQWGDPESKLLRFSCQSEFAFAFVLPKRASFQGVDRHARRQSDELTTINFRGADNHSRAAPIASAAAPKVLTYHVLAGRFTAHDPMEKISQGGGKATLKTVGNEELTPTRRGREIDVTWDAKCDTARVTIPDVLQSNRVVHVANTVLFPELTTRGLAERAALKSSASRPGYHDPP
jgi:hypothetical protein